MPDDRPGVERQAGVIDEKVRRATAALDSDEAYAVLLTIRQSGVTRFSWLYQEIQIPNQEIVEQLGKLHNTALVERVTAGHGEGQESAYVLTEFGKQFLTALERYDSSPSRPDTDTMSEPESKPKRAGERKKHPDPRPKRERMADEESEGEELDSGTSESSGLTIHQPLD